MNCSLADASVDIMIDASDGKPFLTATDLCDLADIKRPRRANWADQGLVRKARSKERYDETDAAELVAFVALVRRLEFEDASLVWEDVRLSVRQAARDDGLKLVLVDQQNRIGIFLGALSEVGAVVRPGRAFVLLDLTDAIADSIETCLRIRRARNLKAGSPPSGNVHPLRRSAEGPSA
jgi:hypothetical protein